MEEDLLEAHSLGLCCRDFCLSYLSFRHPASSRYHYLQHLEVLMTTCHRTLLAVMMLMMLMKKGRWRRRELRGGFRLGQEPTLTGMTSSLLRRQATPSTFRFAFNICYVPSIR